MKLNVEVEFSQDELDKMVVQEVLDKQSEAMTVAADKIVEAKLQYFTDKLAAEVTAAHRKTQTTMPS